MIGQQKRSLEHSVSPQPTKYQKHYDDNFCETSTRVASSTGEQLDIQELFSGVHSNLPSSSPSAIGCDSTKSHGKAPARDPSGQLRKPIVHAEVDPEAKSNSCHEPSDPSASHEVCEPADITCTRASCELKVDNHKESVRLSADLPNHAQDTVDSVDLFSSDNSGHARLHSAEDFSSLPERSRQREVLLKNAFKETSSQAGGIECGGSCQEDEGPNTTNASEMGIEGDRAFLESVRKTVELRRPNGSRPLPVFLSGKVMNLYLMNEQVKAHGGYQSVTSEGLWGKISQTLGFVPECGPGVKLIYFKYLKGLERETSQILEAQPDATSLDVALARMEDFAIESRIRMEDEKEQKCSLFVGEQFAESDPYQGKPERTTMNDDDDSHKKGVSRQISDHLEDQNESLITRKGREAGRSHSYHRGGGGQGCERMQSGSARFGNCNSSQGWEDTQAAQSFDRQLPRTHEDLSGPRISKRDFGREMGKKSEESPKAVSTLLETTHQPLTSTLIWIKRMALDPCNPYMGEGVEGGQNEEWVKDCASQAERIRGFFWKRKEEMRLGEAHLHQAKQISTPSHYYEEVPQPTQQSIERFRATRERVVQYGYPGSPGSHRTLHESSHYLQRGSSPQSQSHWSSQTSHRLPRQSTFHPSYIETGYPDYLNFSDRPRKRIPIGPDFQAHVPPRKSIDAKSACKREGALGDETQNSDEDDEESGRWLGKQVWPPPGFKSPVLDVPVGVGRALTCTCLDPESMDCVRIHVQEERLRLERELGQAFYIWKFDEMGECVSDRWTKEEERTFRTLVKMNPPSLDKNFWEQLPETFPGKTMKELVSYYFNVFMLRRRAVQNRLEGRQSDSDDDETELPEGDSEDSEDYDSGEEPDEEADEDASEAEDDTYQQNDTYGGGRSEKLLEHTGFCDIGGVNLVYCSTNMANMDADEGNNGVSLNICTSSDINLENEEQDFRSLRREERDVRLHSDQLTSKSHEQHHEERHLETHVSLVGDEELQEVKTWEDPHWDEADHDQDDLEQDAVVDATFSGKANERAISPTRNISGHKRVGVGDDQQNPLASCEGEVWVGAMDTASSKDGDKLLSTNGMIQELFGDESPDANSPS